IRPMKPGTLQRELSNAVFVSLGVLSAGLGLKGFLLSSHFIDGGVTGVSMLLAEVLGWPLAVLIPVLNVPFVVLGWSSIGRAAAFFLGIEQAMYSMLTYFAASRTLDFVVHGIEEYTAVLVVTPRSEEVRAALTGELGRGVTVLRGRGGVSDADQDVLYCVVTR